MHLPVLAFLAAATIVSSAAAQPIAIQNFSFENPATPDGTFIAGPASPPTGWTFFGSTSTSRSVGVLNPATTTLYTQPVPEGRNVAVIFLMNAGGPVGLEQVLADTLQLNTTYTLTLSIGNIGNDPNPPHNAFNFTGFPGYRVEVTAGGTVLAFDQNSVLPAEGAFLPTTVTFTTGPVHALAGQPLGLRLINLNGPNGIEVNFDNVLLNATVAAPEPGTVAAGGLAVATLALWARRRRR